ncbi:nuclear transport factor 2 family protein [Planotetraspora thailandica]|nr:nuclear transport factor 2 family protein [Planotetraspora thailandica]
MKMSDSLYRALNAHDLGLTMRQFHPQAVLVTPVGIMEGHEQIAWHYEHMFGAFPDLVLTTWHRVSCGDPALNEWTMSAVHSGPFLIPGCGLAEPTGRRVLMRGCSACTVDHGLIVVKRVYYDQLELCSQLGYALSPSIQA